MEKEAEKAEELQTKLDGLEQQNLTELEKEKKAREAAERERQIYRSSLQLPQSKRFSQKQTFPARSFPG